MKGGESNAHNVRVKRVFNSHARDSRFVISCATPDVESQPHPLAVGPCVTARVEKRQRQLRLQPRHDVGWNVVDRRPRGRCLRRADGDGKAGPDGAIPDFRLNCQRPSFASGDADGVLGRGLGKEFHPRDDKFVSRITANFKRK